MARVGTRAFFMDGKDNLRSVFESAEYCIEFEEELVALELSRPVPDRVTAWLKRYNGGRSSWLITAHNPGGVVTSPDDNRAQHERLDALLDRSGLYRLPSINRDPADEWPDEPGWLVAGLEEGLARSLGRRFGQAALVAVSCERAELIWITD